MAALVIPVHGGDLAAAARAYGVAAESVIDFSANISPYGPPLAVVEVLRAAAEAPRSLAPYPEPTGRMVRDAVAAKQNVDPEAVVVGQGAAALIDAAVREARAPAWLVPVPAFSEYRRAIAAAGAHMIEFDLDQDFDLDEAAFVRALRENHGAGVVLNTPHNPSGRAWTRDTLLTVLDACIREDRPFILDEAFVDYEPERSFVHEALAHARAVVIRSLTKFYGIAGVRIGVALAPPPRARALRALMPSWSAGTLDLRIAIAALGDVAYEHHTRENNAIERRRLAEDLNALGLRPLDSSANFLLVDLQLHGDEFDVALQRFAREGVVVRDCRSYERLETRAYVRIAVLARPQNECLVQAFAAALRVAG